MRAGPDHQKKPAGSRSRTTTSPFVVQCPQRRPAGSSPRDARVVGIPGVRCEKGRAGGRARFPALPLAVSRAESLGAAVATGDGRFLINIYSCIALRFVQTTVFSFNDNRLVQRPCQEESDGRLRRRGIDVDRWRSTGSVAREEMGERVPLRERTAPRAGGRRFNGQAQLKLPAVSTRPRRTQPGGKPR